MLQVALVLDGDLAIPLERITTKGFTPGCTRPFNPAPLSQGGVNVHKTANGG